MTETAGAAPNAVSKALPIRFLQAVTAYWILLKLAALFIGEPHWDEAYYWIWGQHPALSYFDHAPLHAWMQGAVAAILGWSLFSLRFLSLAMTVVVLAVLYLWARRLEGQRWRHWFWLSAALFFSSPLMLFYTTIATHDRILVAFVILALHFFAWFFCDWTEGRRRHGALYLGAIMLGLATLTKYNGVLLGVGILATVLIRADLRSLLRNPHLYVAALVSVAMQLPVLYWNVTEGFASFRFHLADASGQIDLSQFRLDGVVTLALESALMLSPIAIYGMARFLVVRAGGGFAGVLHSLGKWTFIVSTLTVLVLAAGHYVLFYWNIVAYTAFFGLAGWFIRSRLLQAIQIGYGLVLSTILMTQFAVFPVLQLAGIAQPQTSHIFGWRQVAEAVRSAEAAYGAEFAAAPSWFTAARLGFGMERADVPALTASTDAYDFWFDPGAYAGKDAIIVADQLDLERIPELGLAFDTLEAIGTVDTERFGQKMATYTLYLGRNFHDAQKP